MRNSLMCFLVFLISCINDINTTSTLISTPDIQTSILLPVNTVFLQNQEKDIIVKVHNVGTSITTGPIKIIVPYINNFNIHFDVNQLKAYYLLPPNYVDVTNTEWKVERFNDNLILTTNLILEPSKSVNIGIKLKAISIGNYSTVFNIFALPYTGGENNISNNGSIINCVIN